MLPSPPSRRISYVIPPPASPAPVLKLPPLGYPRNGRPEPLLQYARKQKQSTATTDSLSLKDKDDVALGSTRHRLGVTALALDSATQLAGNPSPEGLLYTGGKDGMIISWELGIPMKSRIARYGAPTDISQTSRKNGRWELMTGWADDAIDEDDEDEPPLSTGDILGDVKPAGGRRGSRSNSGQEIPYEDRWETDPSKFLPGSVKPSHFRQSTQAHTDWVNDLVLCNLNQTVISASSDGTVKAWNPHAPSLSFSTTIGTHSDYVRCLALSRERQWVASGSFDRTIKLWDLNEARTDPLMTLQPPEQHNTKSSVYALASDPAGHVIASGSPERVVRTWDPRSGKRIGKLVGHTDNIRAILISDDSRYMLTGSADASIKLWSILSPQRCIHTFTHHTESVWSLFSSHPNLEAFYSTDRSGFVCKVDLESCTDIGDGECLVVCKENEGVNKVIVMDDNVLWTATGSSSIKRWRSASPRQSRGLMTLESPIASSPSASSPQRTSFMDAHHRTGSRSQTYDSFRRGTRLTAGDPFVDPSSTSLDSSFPPVSAEIDTSTTLFGIPYDSLIKLASTNDHFPSLGSARSRDPEVATLYSAASVMSVPRLHTFRSTPNATPSGSTFPVPPYGSASGAALYRGDSLAPPDLPLPGNTARMNFEERDVAVDAKPLHDEPDEILQGDHGLVRGQLLSTRVHALSVNTIGEVAVWDMARAQCIGRYLRDDVLDAVREASNAPSEGGSSGGKEDSLSPRQALETVKERIEGEAVVTTWGDVDTQIGEMAINITSKWYEAEIFADEVGYQHDRHINDETRFNLGKWVLRNLFLPFIREEQREASIRRSQEEARPSASHGNPPPRMSNRIAPGTIALPSHSRFATDIGVGMRTPGISTTTPMMTPVIAPDMPTPSTPRFMSQAPPSMHGGITESPLSPIPQSPTGEPTSPPALPPGLMGVSPGSPTPRGQRDALPPPPSYQQNSTQPQAQNPSTSPTMSADYFSLRRRQSVSSQAPAPGPTGGVQPPTPDDFSGWGGPAANKPTHSTAPEPPPTPVTPGGGFMGRIKNLGRGVRKTASEADAPLNGLGLHAAANQNADVLTPTPEKTLVERIKMHPLTPPSSAEHPSVTFPPATSVIISENSPSGYMPIYRNLVSNVGQDMQLLEELMPDWLLEYLLQNKAPPLPNNKVGFILLPAPTEDPKDQLPELLNTTQSKLSSSKYIRVRKLAQHVQDKLDRISAAGSTATTPRTSVDLPPGAKSSGSSPPGTLRQHLHVPNATQPRLRAEDMYEILCNDFVLPIDMTLAAVRQFVWRNPNELTMYYRRKPTPTSPAQAQANTSPSSGSSSNRTKSAQNSPTTTKFRT